MQIRKGDRVGFRCEKYESGTVAEVAGEVMRVHRKEAIDYKGYTIALEECEVDGKFIWHWRATKDGAVKIGDSLDGGGWSDRTLAVDEAKAYINDLAADEEYEQEQRQIERDRWWLERATEFKVGEIDDWPVTIRGEGDRWFVMGFRDATLNKQGVWVPPQTPSKWDVESVQRCVFSDREAALQAYKSWKQQQEGK